MMCKGKYIDSSFFNVKSPVGILTTTTCHVDVFQFMKTGFFVLIGLMSRSNPEILPKLERGEPGSSLNTIEGEEGSDSLLHPYSKCRYLSC